MGFVKERGAEGLWMTLNGGAMQISSQQPDGATDPVFNDVSIKSGGYGIIDVAWKVRKRCIGCSTQSFCFEYVTASYC